VNLDPQARPLRESLGQLTRQVEKFPFAGMRLFERRTYDMKCNWKTYVDNYLEGYHLPSVHPGLNRELDYNAYVVEPDARHLRQFSPIRGAPAGDAKSRRYPEARRSRFSFNDRLLLDFSQLDAELLSRQRLVEYCSAG
jgi:phenylpropionate dioxygenase-like ring-hydroxylating dioxygenase large terminal subunit